MVLKHLAKESTLLPYLRVALADRFATADECDGWYQSLPSDSKRDTALRVLSSYLALVKAGDWHVDMEGSNAVVDYFTDTYKCIGIIALIESLGSERYIDFHQYLVQNSTRPKFPISREVLDDLYETYKKSFGSSKAVLRFFQLLPEQRQAELAKTVEIIQEKSSDPPTLTEVVRHLYQVRSNFVHGGTFAHDLASLPVLSKVGGRSALVSLSVKMLGEFFEEAFMAWCERA